MQIGTSLDLDWWKSLNETWKKIFNAEIGKIEHRPSGMSANYIFENGTTEQPNNEDLLRMENIDSIEYMFSSSTDSPRKVVDLEPLLKVQNLKNLNLSTNKVSNLEVLSNLHQLEELDLSYNNINELKYLSGLTNLRKLNLSGNLIYNIQPLKN